MANNEQWIIADLITHAECMAVVSDLGLLPVHFTNKEYGTFYGILLEEYENQIEFDIDRVQIELAAQVGKDAACGLLKELMLLDLDSKSLTETTKMIINSKRMNDASYEIEALLKTMNPVNINEILEKISDVTEKYAVAVANAHSMAEMVNNSIENVFKPKEREFVTGFNGLDNKFVISGGNVYVIGAISGVGKSAVLLNILLKMAKSGKRILLFNLEMPEEEISQRVLAIESGISLWDIQNKTEASEEEKRTLKETNEKMIQVYYNSLFVVSKSVNITEIKQNIKNYSPDLVAVDYLQLIESEHGKKDRWEQVAIISKDLKKIAMKNGVPIIATVQLNNKKNVKTIYEEPYSSDIRESGDIQTDASTILLMWREKGDIEDKTKIKIDKNRQGALGVFDFCFDGSTMTFYEEQEFHKSNEKIPY